MPLPNEFIRRKSDPVAPVKPWITGFMLILSLILFYQASSHGMLWLKYTAFSPGKFELFRLQHQYLPILNMMLWATFAPVNTWHLFGNAYFLWVFGSLVELRLGTGRFLALVLIAILGGWIMQAYEAGLMSYGLFIGPGLLTASIIGAYLVFFPEKKINPGGTIGRSTKFFKNEPDRDVTAAFGISPWWLITAFVVYQVAMHFILAKMPVGFDNMHLISAIGAFLLGLASCALMVASAAQGVSGNPLKILAVQRYRQLRALDIGHEDAIEGTAKLMSCPVDQVKQWITKGGGALPTQPSA